MHQDQHSRRSVLGSLAALLAWLTGTPAAAPAVRAAPPGPARVPCPPPGGQGSGAPAALVYGADGLPRGLSVSPASGFASGAFPPVGGG